VWGVDSKQQSRKRLTTFEDEGTTTLIGDCWRDRGRVRRRVSQLGESGVATTTLAGEVEVAGS